MILILFNFNYSDSYQLAPVCDSAIWTDAGKKDPKAEAAIRQFKTEFKRVITLTEIMRQRGEDEQAQAFRRCLMNLRVNKATQADYELLATRRISPMDVDMQAQFVNAIRLKSQVEDVNQYNNFVNARLAAATNKPLITINSINMGEGANAKNAKFFSGLEQQLEICVGARVMIISNLWTAAGLTNGAQGTVKHIVFRPGEAASYDQPQAIILQMEESYRGPSLPGMDRCVVISPKAVHKKDRMGQDMTRIQFPIRPAAACTIHKCQGNLI